MASHPTVGDMVKHPYGVVENYVDPDGQIYEGIYAGAVRGFVPDFEYHFNNLLFGFLLNAAQNERAKELNYINSMLASFDDNLKNSVLYKDFMKIYNSVVNIGSGVSMDLSILVDTIQKMKLGLYELDKEVKQNFDIFKDINENFLDKNIVAKVQEALQYSGAGSSKKIIGEINVNTNGKAIIDSILKGVENDIDKALKSSDVDKETKEGQRVLALYEERKNRLMEIYRAKLEEWYTRKFTVLDRADKILEMKIKDLEAESKKYDIDKPKTKKILVNSDYEPRTLQQILINIISGELGGKSPEYVLDIDRGGMNTGNIKKEGLNVDADNIQLADANCNFYFSDWKSREDKNNKIQWNEIGDFDVFLDQVKRIEDFESKFMIMYSDKDQSVSKEFKNQIAHSDVKIKGSASLNKRGPEIINMYNMIDHPGEMDPTDLIFSIANLAQEFVCNGQVDQAKRTLGAICVGWMFDDVKEIVQGSSLIQGTATIHFYNINNYYYTLSDILYKTSQALNSKNISDQSSYVKIGISVPKGKIYETMIKKNKPDEGMPRWESISDTLMSKTNIDIHMNPKNLFNALFSGVFGKI